MAGVFAPLSISPLTSSKSSAPHHFTITLTSLLRDAPPEQYAVYQIGSPIPLEGTKLKKRNQPRMQVCMNIECGGKLQPHSFDSSAQKGDRRRTGMDCDGPCSKRRVANWKHKQTASPYTQEPTVPDNRTDEEVRRDMCHWKQ